MPFIDRVQLIMAYFERYRPKINVAFMVFSTYKKCLIPNPLKFLHVQNQFFVILISELVWIGT